MKSLVKSILSIAGGIIALAGLTVATESCDEDKSPDEKLDCKTVDDPCEFPECQHLCTSGIYGPLPNDEIDCKTVDDPCKLPECEHMCSMTVYGPGPTEEEMLEYCCGKNDASDAYKDCVDDYDRKRACDHIPATCYTGDHCNYDDCANAPICTDKKTANCDTVENPCSYDECKNSHKCVGTTTEIDCYKDGACKLPECVDKEPCYIPEKLDCNAVEDPCKQIGCEEQCEERCASLPTEKICLVEKCVDSKACLNLLKECCGEDADSEEYKTCVEDYTKNGQCPKKE